MCYKNYKYVMNFVRKLYNIFYFIAYFYFFRLYSDIFYTPCKIKKSIFIQDLEDIKQINASTFIKCN